MENLKRQIIHGEMITSGFVQGQVCFINSFDNHKISKKTILEKDIDDEIHRFNKEVIDVIDDLNKTIKDLKCNSFIDEAEIIQTHVSILNDSEFRKKIQEKIRTDLFSAEVALEHVLKEIISIFEKIEDITFRERSVDFQDIGLRLRNRLTKENGIIFSELLKNVENPIVVAKQLTPFLVLELKDCGVKGFIVEKGTSFSHAAILSRSFGLPVLKVNSYSAKQLKNFQHVLVDAINTQVIINPEDKDFLETQGNISEKCIKDNEILLPVNIWLNIVDPKQLHKNDLKGTKGIGLYRTEFLFMHNRKDFPSEDDQFAVYSELFAKCEGYSITIRTLDVGSDKELPYFSLGPQDNPALGLRAHRIYHFHPEILKTQLKAILRAGVHTKNLRILYPMIEGVDELLFVQNLLEEAINTLKKENRKYCNDFQQGVLIEVPSAVWGFRELLNYIDFASIGTNDLFQYFYAKDRNNANVYVERPLDDPVALQMLKSMVDISDEIDKPLNICGEISSDIHALSVLIGLGFKNLSMDFHVLSSVKKHFYSLDISECKKMVEMYLKIKSHKEMPEVIQQHSSAHYSKKLSNITHNDESIDPICKMIVHTKDNPFMVKQDGKEYFFCCLLCRDKFIEELNKTISLKKEGG